MDAPPAAVLAVRDVVSELRVLAGGIDHPEGVAWCDGAVYCGTEAGKLLRIDAEGGVEEVADTGGFLLGMAFDGDGNCYACDQARHEIVRIDRGGRVEPFVAAVEGRRLSIPNYPAFSSDGTLWFTDSGTGWGTDDGCLCRVAPGREPERVDDECRRFPNGLAWSPDESALYVVETGLPGVVRYRSGGAREEWLRLERVMPDGLAFDRDGTLYIGCWRPDRVYRVTTDARPEVYLDDFTAEYLNSPTNLCFAGDGLDRICFASLCGWMITDISAEIPGAPLPRPRL
jgi:gluconolactonase